MQPSTLPTSGIQNSKSACATGNAGMVAPHAAIRRTRLVSTHVAAASVTSPVASAMLARCANRGMSFGNAVLPRTTCRAPALAPAGGTYVNQRVGVQCRFLPSEQTQHAEEAAVRDFEPTPRNILLAVDETKVCALSCADSACDLYI